jgi:hypothetical protein
VGSHPVHGVASRVTAQDGQPSHDGPSSSVTTQAPNLDLLAGAGSIEQSPQGTGEQYWSRRVSRSRASRYTRDPMAAAIGNRDTTRSRAWNGGRTGPPDRTKPLSAWYRLAALRHRGGGEPRTLDAGASHSCTWPARRPSPSTVRSHCTPRLAQP